VEFLSVDSTKDSHPQKVSQFRRLFFGIDALQRKPMGYFDMEMKILWLVSRLSCRLYGWCVNRIADFYVRNAGDRLVGVAPAERSSRSSSTPTPKGKR
jgi:hypothetical protein